jgi:Tfp pilus assembly protein FimT
LLAARMSASMIAQATNGETDMTKKQTATAPEVRKYYKDQGCLVRITVDGRVSFCDKDDDQHWLDGRWVSEYRVIDGQVHLA